MIVGNIQEFAIESEISVVEGRHISRALGFFVIHVGGKSFGVRKPDATYLGCSFDEVARRVIMRGNHNAPFSEFPEPATIALAFREALFGARNNHKQYCGLLASQFRHIVNNRKLQWAPDGDAAFDDGSYVIQFDILDKCRIIAFTATEEHEIFDPESLRELWLPAKEFYGVLSSWLTQVRKEVVLKCE